MYGIDFTLPKPHCPQYPEKKSNFIPKDQKQFTVILEENGTDYIFPQNLVNEFSRESKFKFLFVKIKRFKILLPKAANQEPK